MGWKYYEVATPSGIKVVVRNDLGYPVLGEFTLSEELMRERLYAYRIAADEDGVSLSKFLGGICYRK